MRLRPPFETLTSDIAEFNERKIELYQTMSQGCEAMLVGLKPGIDYAAIATEAPKITATLEYIDQSISETTCLTLRSQ